MFLSWINDRWLFLDNFNLAIMNRLIGWWCSSYSYLFGFWFFVVVDSCTWPSLDLHFLLFSSTLVVFFFLDIRQIWMARTFESTRFRCYFLFFQCLMSVDVCLISSSSSSSFFEMFYFHFDSFSFVFHLIRSIWLLLVLNQNRKQW